MTHVHDSDTAYDGWCAECPPEKRRVYIAGPMSGYDDHNFPAFAKACDDLEAWGYQPVSPHMIDPEPHEGDCTTDGLPWRKGSHGHDETCNLRADIKELLDCKAIYMLRGWQASPGARLELQIAVQIGLEIHFEVVPVFQGGHATSGLSFSPNSPGE